ncbi:DUF5979 domain-containing protein [Comamonas sp.]|uniref:DUF5979 domain-containing protein n=1 Tax=Comamonas sp. TaxID=34028 RepID=UPI0028A09CAE|nr:DUF5979 domain-containing protein [Comamonas sp.]
MIKNRINLLWPGAHAHPSRSAAREGAPLRGALGKTLLALAGFCALAAPAHAAISITSVVVSADGQGPFDADNNPGNDSGPLNGVVRTQDTVLYTINYNASNTDSSTITATLPAGMRWDPTATAGTVCNGTGGGSLNAARTVLTCNRAPSSAGVESFQVLSWVGAVGNGAAVTMTAASGGSSATSGPVTVSATPRADTRVRYDTITRVETTPGSGVWLRLMPTTISLGSVLPASGNFKGYEALQNPVSVTIKVQPGAVVLSCPPGASCNQAAPGADVTMQFTAPVTHYLDANAVAGFEAAWRQTASYLVRLGVPEDPNFPSGVVSRITAQLTNFAPLSLSGQPSAVAAPGYEAGFSCTANASLNATQTCLNAPINRSQPLQISMSGGAVSDGSNYLYGDGHGYTQGFEKVTPGQTFHALAGLANNSNSEQAATDVESCVVWNPALLELRAASSLKLSPLLLFYLPLNMGAPDVAPADMVLEYSAQPYADDAARRAANCGLAGDNNPLWTSDYASLPPNTITSVRFAYRPNLLPGQTLGLVLPLQRSTSATSLALADDAPLPWFRQYFTDATGRIYSTYAGNGNTSGETGGGYVQAASALVRHSIEMPPSVAPGAIFPVSVIPRTIGAAAAGIDAVSRGVEYVIDFPNTYIQPIASSIAAGLPPGAFYELTPANLGFDGLPGTADDGAPAKLVVRLGDLPAPGGAAGPAPHQGHVTTHPPITFQAQAAFISPVGAYPLTSLISATNDLSFADYTGVPNIQPQAVLQDRREVASTTVSGVAGFQMSKSLVAGGTVDNTDPANPVTRITAGQPFTYAISFGNATSLTKGQLRMVDVLPFDGDLRGTTGLGALQMLSVDAAMADVSQGTIVVEYTTTPAATVQAAVRTVGNEDAATGVAWQPYTAGAPFPAGVTALRFTTSSVLNPGYSGIANLQMRTVSPLSPTTQLFNDVFGREQAPGGLVLTASGSVQLSGQAAASLTGSVFLDANMNNTPDAGEADIAGVTATLTCDAGPACVAGETHTAVTNASGVYSFAPGATVDGQANFPGLASGSWTLSITPAATLRNVGSTAGTVNGAASGTPVGRSISGIVVATGATAIDYRFAEHEVGALTINKALTLPGGVNGPFDFGFTATCDLPTAGFTYPATLVGYPGATSVAIEGLPAGATCTVTEDTLPAAPALYEWAAPTTPAAVVIPANSNAAVTVTNALNPLLGGITITKDLALPGDAPGPFTFTYTATCDLPTAGSVFPASLTYPTATSTTIAGVPAGAQCVVAEGPLPAAPANYTWGPAAANANVTVPLNATAPVTMASTLVRVLAGIEVTKTLALPDGVTGPFSFGFTATCNLPTPGSVFSATLANYPTNTRVTIPGIPSGASCAVTENAPLPAAPNGYQWGAPSVPAPVTVPASGVASVGVTNTLVQQFGTITINKTLTLPQGVNGPFNFTYTATCDLPTAGTVFPASLSYPGATSTTIANVPAGAQCVVAEGPAPTAPTNFTWGPAPANATVTVVANSDVATTMASTLVRGQAGIEVTKTLALPSGVTGPFNFGFTATCDLPAAGTTYTATLANYPANTKVTIANVPAGANCSVVEDQPLPAAPANYSWAAPSVPAPVVVPATGAVAVSVTNALTGKQGNIQVNATTTLPDGVAGPFNFVLTATCDLPTAGTTHSVTLTAPPAASAMITGVQAGAQCTITETLPDAPAGYRWADPAFDQTTVTVEADSDMPVALTNELTKVQAANPVPVPVDSRMALMLLAMLMMAAAGVHMRKR